MKKSLDTVFMKSFTMSTALFVVVTGGWILGSRYTCAAVAPLLLFWFVLAGSLFDTSMHRRRCLRECYLSENSILSKTVLSPLLVTLWAGL